MRRTQRILGVALAMLFLAGTARAETPEEWVALGTRVHGFFGGFIPAGIRIGLDALEQLKAKPRDLTVTYWKGEKAVCPCALDGVMLAVGASPGQGTVTIAPEPAPAGTYAVIVIRDRKTGAGLKYTVTLDWQPKMLSWNKEPPLARFDAAMKAEGLFKVEPVAKPN
jgi:formylmethanofuran dehydrogenase subunit E